jgi:hypothetical protein
MGGMELPAYSTDLTEDQWQLIEPLLLAHLAVGSLPLRGGDQLQGA